MKKSGIWFFLLLGVGLILSRPLPLQAAVVINELHPLPTTGSDWIELHNTGTQIESLGGWTLEDQLSSPSLLQTFSNSTNVLAGEYLVIEVAQKLNNTGDGVTLKNAQGTIVDQLSYNSVEVGKSWARWPNGNGSLVLTTPSRGEATQFITPTVSPSPTPSPTMTPSPSSTPWIAIPPVQASEFNACPLNSESEWFELFNPDPVSYTLQNWKLRDASQNSKTISATIPAYSWAVVSWSGSLLNNTGDSVRLETPDGQKVWEIELDACQTGSTWAWYQNQWQLTTIPTPGGANVMTPTLTPTPVPATASGALQPTGISQSLPTTQPSSHPSPNLVTSALKERLQHIASPSSQWQTPLLAVTRSSSQQTVSSSLTVPLDISAQVSSSPQTLVGWISVILTGIVFTGLSGYQLYVFIKKRYAPGMA